jgi:quinol-cytochrome oxidoreductase complex cytochrome b subunit
MKWANQVRLFLQERLGLEAIQFVARKKHVPLHACTPFYYLGGMALFLFLVQIVTGILLSLYYKPSPDQAFESVQAIVTEVEFGWLIRSAHSWSANLVIAVLFLHLLTTYMMRAYRRPRELTWVTGVLLLGLFMAFGFSGYLLPWNELSFFATRVGTAIVGRIPFIGEQLLLLARGGEDVTGDTLARFYALHVVVLPMATFVVLGIHVFLVQKHGMSVPDHEMGQTVYQGPVRRMPFVPHFLLRDMVGWYLALALLAALAALFPWELGEKADPFASAPTDIKPEWYFLFMFQALKVLPPYLGPFEGEVVGVVGFGLVGLVVLLVPFIDRGPRTRGTLNMLTILAIAFFIPMTAWGWFSAEHELGLRIILGGLLTLIVLMLVVPFTVPGSAGRRTLYALLVLGALVLFAALARELA